MQISGSNELAEQILKNDLCVVCGACVGLCPYFKVYRGKVAMTFPCDLTQGRCYAHCPRTGVDDDGLFQTLSQKIYGKPHQGTALGEYRRILVSKAGDNMASGSFQNGGTVSALITLALKTGTIDAAVLTDSEGLTPVPRLVTREEDVVKCASAKYMATPTVSCVNQGAAEGYDKMGVVGTSCQMTAIARMKCNLLDKTDFKDPVALTVGLFCTWALDYRAFVDFLSQRMDLATIRSMDIPPPPADVMIVKTTDKKMEIPLSEIRPLIPKGCSVCPDMTAEWADVSVGAYEGKPGWNTLIVRSGKGDALVDEAVKQGYLVIDELPESSLAHLTEGSDGKRRRALENTEKMAADGNAEVNPQPAAKENVKMSSFQ